MKYVLIIGAGKSGKSVCNYISTLGLLPVLFDDEFITRENQIKWVVGCEYVVVSPSVAPSNEVVMLAKKLGKNIIGDIELTFIYRKLLYKQIVGVTGTNGKTTVVSMLGHILGEDCNMAGNIGIPWMSVSDKQKRVCVLELSSFQLMSIKTFKPDIACILNLAPDHIDYHGSESDYYNAKLSITKNLTSDDWCVLNFEDAVLCKLVNTTANKLYFGYDNTKDGCFIKSNSIYLREGKNEKFIIDLDIIGDTLHHNVLNIMAGVCILSKIEYNLYSHLHRIMEYKYEPYRMAFVGEVCGAKVYNDSKSTNVASALVGLKALSKFSNIALILGGRYKNESFNELFKFKNIKQVYIFGESKNIIYEDAKKLSFENVSLFNNLDEIVNDIFLTKKFDAVLFSPACASFDMYSSYKERGMHFDELIKKIKQIIN